MTSQQGGNRCKSIHRLYITTYTSLLKYCIQGCINAGAGRSSAPELAYCAPPPVGGAPALIEGAPLYQPTVKSLWTRGREGGRVGALPLVITVKKKPRKCIHWLTLNTPQWLWPIMPARKQEMSWSRACSIPYCTRLCIRLVMFGRKVTSPEPVRSCVFVVMCC